jgi:hypothetical protein
VTRIKQNGERAIYSTVSWIGIDHAMTVYSTYENDLCVSVYSLTIFWNYRRINFASHKPIPELSNPMPM